MTADVVLKLFAPPQHLISVCEDDGRWNSSLTVYGASQRFDWDTGDSYINVTVGFCFTNNLRAFVLEITN